MEMKPKREDKPVLSTALLKVKYIRHDMNPESVPFEEFINSSNTSIKIDFPDGRYLMEEGFRSVDSPLEKFYMEFFDEFDSRNMMDYLSSEESDFRVTSMDGSVIRLSLDDYEAIPREIKDDPSTKPLKEYVFVKEKKGILEKFKRLIDKKDN